MSLSNDWHVYLKTNSYDLNQQAVVFQPNSWGLKKKETLDEINDEIYAFI